MKFTALLAAAVSCYSVSYRVEKLEEQSAAVINLNTESFNLFTESPRNYTVFALLTTTLTEHNCEPCRQFTPEYTLVAEGWKRVRESGKMYFGVVDYKNAQPIFQKYKISNVPVVYRFPPTEGPMKIKGEFDTYDIQNNGFSAERFADYVNGRYKTNIAVKRPIDYTPIITKVVGLLAILALGRVFYKYVGAILSLQTLWIAIVLGTTVIMCSGYMWNTIRNPPFLANQNGQVGYIASGFQNQFGAETVIVAILCIKNF
ncbi:oligosaccharyl transferase subunit ost3/OST6 [Boothiomyces macroporosus]|uniref:Oligosaccharyl transferase subunit ost3/OST6 n=1 Tax=Boothiomyces macroporosus TaxID=261099 RepID=A0AAD5UMF6_9FUNG|nr:oligosaccharyl transferase subunit ost3/OST6 [Boothiomyces macroporosus]